MPLRNRVGPDGLITDAPVRGLFTGNRGILHRADKVMGPALWKHRAWICCTLDWQGRKRDMMTGRNWTELFFLDEAVALAAGHRPCAYCRRAAYTQFMDGWQAATGRRPKAPDADCTLHAARAQRGARRLQTHRALAETLPDGAFVAGPHLILGDAALPYTPAGYAAPIPRPKGEIKVLTAPPMLAVLRGGYAPQLHPTVQNPLFP